MTAAELIERLSRGNAENADREVRISIRTDDGHVGSSVTEVAFEDQGGHACLSCKHKGPVKKVVTLKGYQ
jgi:hypothetical protein